MSVIEDRSEWLVDTLLRNRKVTFGHFRKHFFPSAELKDATAAWSTVCNSAMGALKPTLYRIAKERDESAKQEQLILMGGPEQPIDLATDYFRADHFAMEKQRIGEIVAPYLKFRRHWHCFLGSGSTILNIGRQMSELAQKLGEKYSQSFWTINLPLLVDWARFPEKCPVRDVEVPQGFVKVEKGRYRDVEPPSWDTPIVVVAADGCYYDEQEQKARLFSDDPDIAKVTSKLIQLAKDTVIVCIASPKLEYPGELLAGPFIKPPLKEGVQVIVVVDKELANPKKLRGLKAEGWKYDVVYDVKQWSERCKHVKMHENEWEKFLARCVPKPEATSSVTIDAEKGVEKGFRPI